VEVTRFTGGIRYGESYYNAFNASWPFAKLTIEPDAILLNTAFFKKFRFPKNQITTLSKYSGFFSKGLRIEHGLGDYPPFIVFWTFEFQSVKSKLIESEYIVIEPAK
jgi:hypothetical protein